jgi:hypothetical protein
VSPVAYLITYANGHTVVQDGADVEEQTSFSVSRGFSTRRDLDGGSFELTSTEDGRTRRYEPVVTEPSASARFRELYAQNDADGLVWESIGIVSSSAAGRFCARQVSRGWAHLWYLASGTMVLIDGRRQTVRYEPVES